MSIRSTNAIVLHGIYPVDVTAITPTGLIKPLGAWTKDVFLSSYGEISYESVGVHRNK